MGQGGLRRAGEEARALQGEKRQIEGGLASRPTASARCFATVTAGTACVFPEVTGTSLGFLLCYDLLVGAAEIRIPEAHSFSIKP